MNKIRRRTFVSAAAIFPVQALLASRAGAAEQLAESDPLAVALSYRHLSEVQDQNCANCQLYQGDEGAEWGTCAIFPGKLVAADGWCKSWVVKAV